MCMVIIIIINQILIIIRYFVYLNDWNVLKEVQTHAFTDIHFESYVNYFTQLKM